MLVMKVRDTIKLLLDDTWYQVSQTGSHRQYKHLAKPGRVTEEYDAVNRVKFCCPSLG